MKKWKYKLLEEVSYYKRIYNSEGAKIFYIKGCQFIKYKMHQILELMSFIISNKLLRSKDNFYCPICNYYGPFLSDFPETGIRRHAKCPKCGAFERHRLQYLVLNEIFKKNDTSKMSLLHFAPEEFFKTIFRNRFKNYITADLYAKNVDRKEDLTCLSFNDNSFDFIFASHVLEHVKNDLSEDALIAVAYSPTVAKTIDEYINDISQHKAQWAENQFLWPW